MRTDRLAEQLADACNGRTFAHAEDLPFLAHDQNI